jgi:hypothetical protein
MRAGRPVLLMGGEGAALIVSAELLDAGFVETLNSFAAGNARLALPAARLRRLGAANRKVPGVVALPSSLEDALARLEASEVERYLAADHSERGRRAGERAAPMTDLERSRQATAQPGAGVKLTGAVSDWRAVRLPPVIVAVPR